MEDPRRQTSVTEDEPTTRSGGHPAERAAKKPYEQVFRKAPVGVLTYDRNLVIREVNPAFCRILQSSKEKLVGLCMGDLRDRRILPCLERALEGKEAAYEGGYNATHSGAHLWIRMSAAPLGETDGEVRHAVAIVEDVTARKRSDDLREMMLELSEAAHAEADLPGLFAAIHQILALRMPAENLYFALCDEESQTIRFPYFVDRYDPPPGPRKARKGLTEHVLSVGRPLLADRAALRTLGEDGDIEVEGSLPASWLGVPLMVGGTPVGVLALQSYDDDVAFDEHDASILGFVAEQVALGIVRKRHEERIQRLAAFDPLTGLRNRRTLQEAGPEMLALAERKGWSTALLYLDLDRFKAVNDTLGHDAGDELLVEVARDLLATRRQGDLLARIGGDEFALLIPDSDAEAAVHAAQRLLEVFDQRFEVRGHPVHLGGSIGIAVFPEHGSTLEALLKNADIAMYRAKADQTGWSIYDESSSPFSRSRLEREAALREAIQHDELTLVYQPIRSLKDGAIVAYEALARWTLEGRPQAAAEFVSLAEDSGLIYRLDRRVLSRALREMSGFSNAPVAVNVSARTLRSPDLVEVLESALHETDTDPRMLILEITERVAISSFEETAERLRSLRSLGIAIAIDDFGSGHASLNYLRRLPCDHLKIDGSLISEVGHSRVSDALVRAIIALGKGLGLRLVAERVETLEQLEWLDVEGADLVQGYLVGAPTSLALLEREAPGPLERAP